jgi:glutathione S-transferase
MTLQLYGMSFSPYSEKARWALDHHRVPFEWHEHVPLAGELALRMRAGSIGKKASVPLAVDGDVVLRDSVAIARHAEKIGRGSPLVPDDASSREWDEKSAAALGAGRVLVVRRSLEDEAALRDSLPRWMPGLLRGVSTPIAASANRFLLRKYDAEGTGDDAARETMRQQLLALRAALGGRATLASDFSYADLTMAVVLQMVVPVDEQFIRLGDARRRAWTDETLAGEFQDLVAWRDRLYAEHRTAAAV